jgi:hypothetical protein
MEGWLQEHRLPYQRIAAVSRDKTQCNMKNNSDCLWCLGVTNSYQQLLRSDLPTSHLKRGTILTIGDENVEISNFKLLEKSLKELPDDWNIVRQRQRPLLQIFSITNPEEKEDRDATVTTSTT